MVLINRTNEPKYMYIGGLNVQVLLIRAHARHTQVVFIMNQL